VTVLTFRETKTAKAKPFLKWAGGKGQLIDEIGLRLPEELKNGKITTYIEPFVGGGAVFFYTAQKYPSLEQFVLIDINRDLINCYKIIQNNIDEVISDLKLFEELYFSCRTDEKRKELFLKIRKSFNREKDNSYSSQTAAKLIFLNKTCFNGLYRVNRKDLFNVPFGKYGKPNICPEDNLRKVSSLLQKATILCGDFSLCREYVDKHSFIYFDPPYRPISKTASFTSYAKDNFMEEDQIRLADFCKRLTKKHVKFLLSNSDPKNENLKDSFFETHYPESESFVIDRVKASRAINCKGDKRGQINELLITNYEVTNEVC
jgi:DNA adenine methylase